MKDGVYISRDGTMFCTLERNGNETSLSYNKEAFPMNLTKLRKWVYLSEL